jgi:hypothetical protein
VGTITFTDAATVVFAVVVEVDVLGLGVGLVVGEVHPATNTVARTAAAISKTMTCFFTKNLLVHHSFQR